MMICFLLPWIRGQENGLLPSGKIVLLSDTVGFIQGLPHDLVYAFRSTLEESLEADLLIHVVDISSPIWTQQMETVENVLEELGAKERPTVIAFNKTDRVIDADLESMARIQGQTVGISALHGYGIEELSILVEQVLLAGTEVVSLSIPYSMWDVLSEIRQVGTIIEENHDDTEPTITCRLSSADIARISKSQGDEILKLNSMHLDVDPNTWLAQECTEQLEDAWKHIDELVFSNQIKVLRAFSDSRISLTHMWPSTGYGYQDTGREGLESLFAQVFGGESALVRLAWTSGTHVLKTALFGLLRPGDELLSVTGTPYETLQPVIGIGPQCEPSRQTDCQLQQVQPGSLKDFGIGYRETSCLIDFEAGAIDEDMLRQELERSITSSTRLVLIQRSRGYSHRKTISIASLGTFMELVRNKWPHIITFVDNCYCEFTDVLEPPGSWRFHNSRLVNQEP